MVLASCFSTETHGNRLDDVTIAHINKGNEMSSVQIVNQVKGRNKTAGVVYANALSEEITKLAREEAVKNGMNVDKEKNGLFRAMMHVMTRPELLEEARKRTKKRLEDAGTIQKEDNAVVRYK